MNQASPLLRVTCIMVCFILFTAPVLHAFPMNWESSNGPYGGVVNSLRVAPDGTMHIGTESGIYSSTDCGVTWFRRPTPNVLASVVALAFYSTLWMYAGGPFGVYRSGDGGNSWTTQNNGLTNQNVRALLVLATGACACCHLWRRHISII